VVRVLGRLLWLRGFGVRCCRANPVLGPRGGPVLRVGLPSDLNFCSVVTG
jgi:hypothetical protein